MTEQRHVRISVPASTPVADYLDALAVDYGWPLDVTSQLEISALVDLTGPRLDVLLEQLIDRAGELPVTVCYEVARVAPASRADPMPDCVELGPPA